jgi:hypothetical protein
MSLAVTYVAIGGASLALGIGTTINNAVNAPDQPSPNRPQGSYVPGYVGHPPGTNAMDGMPNSASNPVVVSDPATATAVAQLANTVAAQNAQFATQNTAIADTQTAIKQSEYLAIGMAVVSLAAFLFVHKKHGH